MTTDLKGNKESYVITNQMRADHYFMNYLRSCKGGEKVAIIKGEHQLSFTVEKTPLEGIRGQSFSGAWVEESSFQEAINEENKLDG